MRIRHQGEHIGSGENGPHSPDIIPAFGFIFPSRCRSPHDFPLFQWWQEFAVAGPRYIAELVEIITVAAGLKTRAEQLVVTLPLLHLGHQPGIVPRFHPHVLHDRKAVEIVEAAGYKLIAALGALRWRRHHKAVAQNIDRDIPVGPDPAALTIVFVPSLKIAAAAANDDARLAVTVERIGQNALIFAVNVKHGNAVTLAAHEADRRRMTKLACDLGAADQPKSAISADHRPLIGIDRKCRDTVSGIIRLP